MAEFSLEGIPRGTLPGAGKGDRLVIIEAEFPQQTIAGGEVCPGSIEAKWGVMTGGSSMMQTLFRAEVVVDSPELPMSPDVVFPDRNSPHYATFNRDDPNLIRHEVPGGILYLLQETFDDTRPVFDNTVLEGGPRPPEDAGYYAFQTFIAAGKANASGFAETEAAATLSALARILTPNKVDADWTVMNMLPSGELPGVAA